MNRREFLAATGAAGVAASTTPVEAQAPKSPTRALMKLDARAGILPARGSTPALPEVPPSAEREALL